ncbi:hypothetical protein PROQFM164_S05g000367 [Penicillium roqueforti FM164]|uniref:Uncharacterized protein n=1 Tax=Penicillium roqueforti (strain FM164) TaxID=1365484 RepID=W6QR37_PENRF|nr:hypothetical protein PROQFM164_S05g000367 [Penicillium roqueforti FM164]
MRVCLSSKYLFSPIPVFYNLDSDELWNPNGSMDSPASPSQSGRANKRKREPPDQFFIPVDMPGRSEQVLDSLKRASRGKTSTIPAGAACSLTSNMSQILQSHPSLKSSSAVDLLDLYLCLWECYTIKSAGKIRLEEERRFLQNSNEWLVRENEKLQQCCNHQELLLWDHHQAFVSVHQGVLGTLQNSDRPSCQINELQ